jgi:hypothetical protein
MGKGDGKGDSRYNRKASTKRVKLKAADLHKNDDIMRRFRKKNYRKQYDKCIDSIQGVNEHCHAQYTTYTVPAMIPGEPHFDMDECIVFLKEELRKADFYVRLMKPGNVLYISWRPQDVEKVQKLNEKKGDGDGKDAREEKDDREGREGREKGGRGGKQQPIVQFNPDSALSNAHLTTSLIMNNPDFAHYKSVQKHKKNFM